MCLLLCSARSHVNCFAKTIWWWKFECNEECTPESVIKYVWDGNIRSIQDDEVFEMWVGSLIICCKPNCAITFPIAFPSWLDLSWLCQFFDLTFKSQINTIRNGSFDARFPRLKSGYFPGDIEYWEHANTKSFCNRCKQHRVNCW